MRKRRRSPDSDDTAAVYKSVFINTNIDTHLALITSDSDTISDIKDEIVLEHGRFFPEMGEIKIHSLKVKRKGFFYHLPDYMLMKTAFEGVNKSWFLHVDVSKPNDMLQIVKSPPTNSFVPTSVSKDNNKFPKSLHDNKLHFDTGDTTENKQINKANKLLGSHVESEPQRDDQETSSSIVKKSKKNKKGSRVQVPASRSLEKSEEDKECTKQNAEFEKRRASTMKDNVTTVTSVGSPGMHNSAHNDMMKMGHMDKIVERNLNSLHDPEVNCTGEFSRSQEGIEKPVESTLPSLSDTKEVKIHAKHSKRAKSSKSKFLDDQVDQVTNPTAVSHLLLADTIDQELPESAESDKGRLISGKDQVPALEHLGSSGIQHSHHDDMIEDNNINKAAERTLTAIRDPEIGLNEELGPLHCKSTAPSALLIIKEVKTHENSRKKISKISRSVVQDEHVGRSKDSTAVFAAKVQPQESIVDENDSKMEQDPDNNLSSNSECPDVLKAFEVNESINGKAIGEKKQNVDKAVGGVQEIIAMVRDADQINDIVSPSLDSPEPGDLARPSENDQICQKIEERDLLVNNNFVEILSRDRPSDHDHNDTTIETVSNTNTSTSTVAEEPKTGVSMKKKARKTVPVVCQDATENTQTHTKHSSSDPNRHTDIQVEKDNELLHVSKRIKASARKSSDASRVKDTPPVESPLNQVSSELEIQKDEEVSECIGKETNVQQYFDSSHHRDEVSREPSICTLAKNNIEEDIAPRVQQDLSKSPQKDSIVSSAGQANNFTESNRLKIPKKKIAKRAVPYAASSSDLDEIRTPKKPASSAFLNSSDATKTVPSIKENVKSLAAPGVKSNSKTNEKRPLNRNTRDRKESSLRPPATTGKNPSSELNGHVVNKSKQEKSFGTTPKSIFRDASSESSLDENGSVDSSGSTRTRTPSEYSSSSSDLSEDAKQKGRNDKDKGGSKKSILNSEISSSMEIPFGTVLKSSSRFKKAKLTASQQLEDPNSQLDDFLPDT